MLTKEPNATQTKNKMVRAAVTEATRTNRTLLLLPRYEQKHHLQMKCSNKLIKHVKVMWTEYRHILDRYEFSWPQCESLPKWCTQEVFFISPGKC